MNSSYRILNFTIIATSIFIILMLFASKLTYHVIIFTVISLYLIMLTGYLFSRIFLPGINSLFRVLASFLFGFFALYFLLFISALFKFDCTYIKVAVPIINICLAIAINIKSSSTTREKKGIHEEIPQLQNKINISQWMIIIATLSFVIAITLMSKDPFALTSDSNDHISYIRTISRTHQAFPQEFYYKEGELLTRDIRKSIYHSLWGSIEALTTRREVHEIWPIISLYGSVFIAIALICSASLLFDEILIGTISVFLFVFLYHSSFKGYPLITIAHSYPFGQIFYLIFISTALRYLLDRKKEFLILALISLTVASWTHVSHLIIGLFILGCFSMFLMIYRDFTQKKLLIIKSFINLVLLSIGLNIPYLLMRYIRDYHPNNEIHTHMQGILYFSKSLYVINPIVFFEASGYLGITSLACIFLFTKDQKKEIPLRLLIHTLIAEYVLVFNPLWFPFLAKKLSYLLIRFEFSVPAMLLPSFLIFSLISGHIRIRKNRVKLIAQWLLVLALVFASIFTISKKRAYSPKRLLAEKSSGALGMVDLFDFINNKLKENNVFASDPLTSYSIPAFTDQFVVCPFDQHSTPNDSTAFERIAECRLLYDPYSSIEEIINIMKKYQARYLVINGRIPQNIQTMFWKPNRKTALAAIERFKKNDSIFRLIYEADDLALFELSNGSHNVTQNKYPEAYPFIGNPVSCDETRKLVNSGINGIFIKEVNFPSKTIKRGHNTEITITWVSTEKQPTKGYIAYLRFDSEFKKPPLYRKSFGKLYRKILEKLKGKRYRFRVDLQPLEGIYPPYVWPLNREIKDKHTVYIPTNIKSGRYKVSIKLDIKAQFPNYTLSDILSDEDKYSGEIVKEVFIE